MVFQNYALWPHMTIFENVAYGLQDQEDAEERRSPKGSTECSPWST